MYGDQIRYYRRRSGMSQQALGEMLGVSATAVHKWERGQSQPDIVALKKMSDLFGVTIDELCDHQAQGHSQQEGEDSNVAVMTRAFRLLSPEEQEKLIAVGKALFEHAFGREEEP